MASSSSNVVGVHYRVGKKIGEGSFGVIFEGTNLLNNQQVAIKFVRPSQPQLHAGVTWDQSSSVDEHLASWLLTLLLTGVGVGTAEE